MIDRYMPSRDPATQRDKVLFAEIKGKKGRTVQQCPEKVHHRRIETIRG